MTTSPAIKKMPMPSWRGLLLLLLPWLLSACVAVQHTPSRDIDAAVSAHVKAAIEYLRYDKPNSAKRHLAAALKMRPKSALVQNGLALLYRYLKDPVKQEEHLRRALANNPNYAPAHNNYGIMLYYQQRYTEAIEQFKAAANDLDNTSSGLAWANLGRCYYKLGKSDAAIHAFHKAELLNSANAGVYLDMTSIYFARKDYVHAEHYYRFYAKAARPQSAEGLWLGIRLAAATDNNDALASYQLALEHLYPTSPQFKLWQRWRQTNGGH